VRPENVFTSDDLSQFIFELSKKAEEKGCNWENKTLPRFLEALSARTVNAERYYEFNGIDIEREPVWRIFAVLLMAATTYE